MSPTATLGSAGRGAATTGLSVRGAVGTGLATTGLAALLAVAAVMPAQQADSLSPALQLRAAQIAMPVPSRAMPSGLESLADYVAQRYCSPSVKPGTAALRALLLATFPDSGSDGIVRDCSIGGTSEHKEGRAFDWHVPTTSPHQHEEALALLDWLTAPDADGNSAAMARRLGIMYMIYDHQIWGAYRPDAGWRPYTGSDPHTSHVHFSLSWPGAEMETSWWTGSVWTGTEAAPVSVAGQPAPTPPPTPSGATIVPVSNPRPAPAPPTGSTPPPASNGGPTTAPAVLRQGSRGDDVVTLQKLLRITADGDFGPATRSAVVAFQHAQGLIEDGVVGPGTWKVLTSTGGSAVPTTPPVTGPAATPPPAPAAKPVPAAPKPVITTVSTSTPGTAPASVLRQGARGADVVTLQKWLGTSADGVFGPGTRAAVVAFQARHLLGSDGVVGPATWAALAGDRSGGTTSAGPPAPTAATPATKPAPKPVPRPAPVIVPASLPTAGTAAPAAAPASVLRQGARGADVVALQKLLGTAADGDFGPATRAAVVAFQQGAHLTGDGVVGPATSTALAAAHRVPAPAAPAAPPAPPPASPVTTTISSSQVPIAGTATPVLRQGARGGSVLTLQKVLGITADGDFGPATRSAVIAFQTRHLLGADGVVGPATWAALLS